MTLSYCTLAACKQRTKAEYSLYLQSFSLALLLMDSLFKYYDQFSFFIDEPIKQAIRLT